MDDLKSLGTSDASKYLVDVLLLVSEVHREECLDKIIEVVQKQPLASSLISKSVCETAVQECNAEQDEEGNSTIGLPPPCLHGTADDKARLFRERYMILQQRTQRHDLFTPPAVGASQDENTKKFQLRPIEYLLGSTAKLGELIVLGMLTQIKEGKWYIEDPTGAVQIDLTTALRAGMKMKYSTSYFGNINFFGGTSTICAKASAKLKKIEEENEEAMFVFLSDVWLDQFKVLEKLRVLFTGYAEFPPTAFILCGNFMSTPKGSEHVQILKECFHSLTELITEFPSLVENSKFVFIPGPQDPGPASIFPRPTIPSSITEEIRKKVPSAVFTSNPCRIQYCTQEIVVFREDIVTKMCRNCVKFPSDGDVPTHFSKTLICQGHLCPLPLHVCPVYWSYDCGLRLYPVPDLIVCADKFDPFHSTTVDCTVMNPGSFPRTDFSFKVYMPATRKVEDICFIYVIFYVCIAVYLCLCLCMCLPSNSEIK
ncbi:hypothetical protein KUTeg_013827 [Tegillarca granosa]|uniref:DNA polymerase II subunit 2 n=1 Tax=Tegillarca granosa TaxID=220873 RepID=A0ABQ9F077_TEGGR|nr:hypothetical protein KUTeg_013827 [Tegillarca granosa]